MAAEKIPSLRTYAVEPGISLMLQDWGGVGDVTALLIHGCAEGAFVWDEFAPQLSVHCKVLTVDLRGHGCSDHDPNGRYTLEKHVSDIKVLLSELRIESLVLVGHSLGGAIATKVAPELDRSLRALVIVDSGPDSDSQTSEFLQYELRDSHRTYARLEEYTEFLKVRRHLANPTTLERLAVASLILGRDGYKPRYDVAALGVLTSKDDDDWWLPSLQGIPSPVLVVRGMYSACLSKRTAVRMCAAAPNGEFKTVPFAGHAVMTDNMEAFAQVVIPFIARACSQRVTTA